MVALHQVSTSLHIFSTKTKTQSFVSLQLLYYANYRKK